MSILCVGVSHQSAPVVVLERLALDADGAAKLAHAVAETEHVTEAAVVSTCNRVEVYAEVDRFHGSVEDVSALFCDLAETDRDVTVSHLYVHYDEGALAHLFTVAAGLDSMVVGESQILGQIRKALTRGQDDATVGPALNAAFQQALRVGKRGHAETGIDRAGPSIVSAALDRVAAQGLDLAGARALVVGAGAMAGLSVAHLDRRGARSITVLNRTPDRAARLAAPVGGRSGGLDVLAAEVAAADVVICCTGATGVVVGVDDVAPALQGRDASRPLAVVDLALPHDLDPVLAADPRVHYTGLAALADDLAQGETSLRSGTTSTRYAASSPRRSRPSSAPGGPPRPPRPSSRCVRWPPTWSSPSWPGCGPGSRRPTRPSASSSSWPCAGWPASCCTPPRPGSRSSPDSPPACPTPRCWPSCSRSRRAPPTR